MKKVIIIGGGASGLISSIVIKRNLSDMVNVTILERLDKVGKKILATGNGRCNFTNEFVTKDKYNHPEFVDNLLHQFGYNETIAFFEDLGLMSKTLAEGRVYPVTENASTVLDVLRLECQKRGVVIKTGFDAQKITRKKERFVVESSRGDQEEADYLIMATGGASSKMLGSNGSGYWLLQEHGIDIVPVRPGLVGLKTFKNDLQSLDGIRVKTTMKIKQNQQVLWQEAGEVLFKNDGVSGIVSMQASSFINRQKNLNGYSVSLDLLPSMTKDDILYYLEKKMNNYPNEIVEILFVGLLNRLIGYRILKELNIDLKCHIKTLSLIDLKNMVKKIKDFGISVKTTYDFDKSQVSIGGVSLKEVNPTSLELKKIPSCYVTGELLDIDGECGGYNLQWAWTSGYIVGSGIVKKERGN